MEELTAYLEPRVFAFTMGLPRMLAAFSILSFIGTQVLGGILVRNAIAICLTFTAYPILYQDMGNSMNELSGIAITGIIFKEVFIGIVLGFIVASLFWAIQAVGFFIDNQRGASMASSMDPLLGEQSSPLGIFLTQTLVAIFFVTGLFLIFLTNIYHSYVVWPVSSFVPHVNLEIIEFFIQQFIVVILLAIVLGAPIIIAMFLTEFGLGLVGRFSPQLNVFFLAMPIKSAVGIALLILYMNILMSYFSGEIRDIDLIFDRLGKSW